MTPIRLIVLSFMLPVACTPYVVPDADSKSAIGRYSLDCSSPHVLLDCEGPPPWADRAVRVDGLAFNIAGTEDGRVVLIERCKRSADFCPHKTPDNVHREHTRDTHGAYIATAYDSVKKTLAGNGISILNARPLVAGFPSTIGRTSTTGYLLELDGDGYSLLRRYSIADAEGE